jgi:hypothetical protein
MRRTLLAGLMCSFLTGCLSIPGTTKMPPDSARAEAAISEKLPLTVPVPITADNAESQLRALQSELDQHLRKLASAGPATNEPN